ncbi:hypothetical protein B0J12DRAFT_742714 [Macrophomina phaseolina]|uniref:ABM domain-containing protein n=1 Tax=Macrophomina phaseolina TaxID=35725 RepID=A0ABQ8G3E8_9PEZI|nr:hypothetical protein B0J12DRAFT_742714 [Macrophomina phaseolina]
MVTHINVDPSTPFEDQLKATHTGPVVLLNVFHVPDGKLEEAIAVWQRCADILFKEPGCISAQLHRGIGGADIMVNYAVWESVAHLMAGLNGEEFRVVREQFPQGTTMSPSVLQKL